VRTGAKPPENTPLGSTGPFLETQITVLAPFAAMAFTPHCSFAVHALRCAALLPVILSNCSCLQAARDNEVVSQEAFGQDAVTARRRQHADSQLLQAFRLVRSLFDRRPRVQPLCQVGPSLPSSRIFFSHPLVLQ